MKEEEATKVARQMEECLCRNACNVCWNNLSREEDNVFWKPVSKRGKPKLEKNERLSMPQAKHIDELNHVKRCEWRVKKTHESHCSIQRRRGS